MQGGEVWRRLNENSEHERARNVVKTEEVGRIGWSNEMHGRIQAFTPEWSMLGSSCFSELIVIVDHGLELFGVSFHGEHDRAFFAAVGARGHRGDDLA